MSVCKTVCNYVCTSFGGGEGKNVARGTFELGIQHRHAGTDVSERPEVIEAIIIASLLANHKTSLFIDQRS